MPAWQWSRGTSNLGPWPMCTYPATTSRWNSLRSSYDLRWTVRSTIDVVGESYFPRWRIHFAVSCVAEYTRSQEETISAMMARGGGWVFHKVDFRIRRIGVCSRICRSTADTRHLWSEAGRISLSFSIDWRDVGNLSAIKPERNIHSEKYLWSVYISCSELMAYKRFAVRGFRSSETVVISLVDRKNLALLFSGIPDCRLVCFYG